MSNQVEGEPHHTNIVALTSYSLVIEILQQMAKTFRCTANFMFSQCMDGHKQDTVC